MAISAVDGNWRQRIREKDNQPVPVGKLQKKTRALC